MVAGERASALQSQGAPALAVLLRTGGARVARAAVDAVARVVVRVVAVRSVAVSAPGLVATLL